MKQVLRFCTLCVLAVVMIGESLAQTPAVKVKREAMSPNRRSSGAPNYTAPPGPWYVSTGLRVVAKGMKVYFSADTTGSGTATVTSYAWSITTKPSGSNAVLDSADKKFTSFTPDVTGQYIVSISVNSGAKTSADTIFVSTYDGNPKTTGLSCATCHPTNNTAWAATGHAKIFKEGVSGKLEVNEYGKGMYRPTCVKCHTTGWESETDNGNFGFLAKKAGWDTTWYKNYSNYLIPNGDTAVWSDMSKNQPAMASLANIGCESCHGPGKDHMGDKNKIAVSVDGGVCNQCHDTPTHHNLGSYWSASKHATMPLSGGHAASRLGCYPCHNGAAFVAYANKKSAPDYSKTPILPSIACATCHDPHSTANPNQLRTVRLDSLVNGYAIASTVGGKGQLCMNCHKARENTVTKVNNQKNKFSDRFYPHYSPQADMFLGANAYEFGLNLTGLRTHGGVKDGCVTCHMSERHEQPDHEMSMEENGADKVEACIECHGGITKFDDIKAATDYDNDGKIESAVAEVQGLLDQLKAKLPKDATGEPVTMAKDSAVVKSHPQYPGILAPLFNYHFVTHDASKGIHNTKYTVALLRASLGLVTGVEMDPLPVPTAFELSQNFPNPFNPSTEIRFAIPKQSNVKLAVFDIMGRTVATLVNKTMEAGNHRVMWNGSTDEGKVAPSGVYFYHIQAESFTATKKMVMIK